MKKYTLWIVLLGCVLFAYCTSSDSQPNVNAERTNSLSEFIRIPTNDNGTIQKEELAQANFQSMVYSFDTIQEGDTVNHSFVFTNTGKQQLQIADVQTTCGCTISDYPKEAIAIGKTDTINVRFASKGRIGNQEKVISVYANTIPNPIQLTLRGYVKEVKK